MNRALMALATLALLAGCATAPPPAPQAALAAAPVFDFDFPDPAVIRAPDGHYFAYATQGMHAGRMHNIPVARSRSAPGPKTASTRAGSCCWAK